MNIPIATTESNIKDDIRFSSYHQQQLNTPTVPTIELDDVFISVKTTKDYHDNRLSMIIKTWFQLAKDQVSNYINSHILFPFIIFHKENEHFLFLIVRSLAKIILMIGIRYQDHLKKNKERDEKKNNIRKEAYMKIKYKN